MNDNEVLKLIEDLILANTSSNAELTRLYDAVERLQKDNALIVADYKRLKKVESVTQKLLTEYKGKSSPGVKRELRRLETMCAYPPQRDPSEPPAVVRYDPNKTNAPFKSNK